ncbi:benzoate/H(+) symporter BenE family transporter [Actinoplanes sp. NEAU-A12]|uniref:Benzoate/H(+) symporter BenE family transporter n=1 Tax=Actinoplanes sandaracinus TaxID=3045177 RepID=A0ABT6WQT9_9ACTN|nr:benzoate/H(+) symporter BenE family transporter [Actinoplanes sandaracinus]MDI6102106.1 benzoate/H(+) symporter BenE family transporter [Actinoplanes sandaracinus]
MAVRDLAPLSAVTAGLVTVLVSVTSTAAIVFSAARAAGAGHAELSSWMLALCVGTGITCIGLSLRYRAPVVTAWSTPGAALLVTALPGFTMREAVGAFLVSALLITVTGLTGWFGRVMDRVPASLAAALLAGVLLQFGIGLFASANTDAPLILAMFATYLACRRLLPRYAVLAALAVGVTVAAVTGTFRPGQVRLSLAEPVLTMPSFSVQAVIGVAVPLFVVTMASQNLPGVAVLRNDGYQVPVSPLITWTGVVNVVLAPLGVFGLNLAAITAAICTGPQAHPDPRRRYLASVWAGAFYLVVGVFGATITSLLAALPAVLVLGIAGIGLLATIGSSLTTAVRDDRWREAAVVTLLATASGVELLGVGSAFWGLIAGLLTAWATGAFRPHPAPPQVPAPDTPSPTSRAIKP